MPTEKRSRESPTAVRSASPSAAAAEVAPVVSCSSLGSANSDAVPTHPFLVPEPIPIRSLPIMYDHLLGRLHEAVASGQQANAVFCEGFVAPFSVRPKVTVEGQEPSSGPVERPPGAPTPGDPSQTDLAALLAVANPSKFGRGAETVYDESVRKGVEVLAGDLVVDYGSEEKTVQERYSWVSRIVRVMYPPRAVGGVSSKISDCLRVWLSNGGADSYVDDDGDVSLRLSKLALYSAGGCFTTHRDTNRGANHVATLLVAVPSDYEGGEFVLKLPSGEEKVWAPNSNAAVTDSSSPAHYSSYFAFYSDLEHEVRPVTRGVRAVLQYEVFVGHPKGDAFDRLVAGKKKEAKTVDAGALSALMHAVSLNVTDKTSIALPLYHLYTKASIRPGFLKGADRGVFKALMAAGDYAVALVPVTGAYYYYEDGSDCEDPCVSQLDPISEYYVAKSAGSGSVFSVEKSSSSAAVSTAFDSCQFVFSKAAQFKHADHQGEEHNGNDAAAAQDTYFSGAMFITRKSQE